MMTAQLRQICDGRNIEDALDQVKIKAREWRFQVEIQALSQTIDSKTLATGLSAIATATVRLILDLARADMTRRHGHIDGSVTIGKIKVILDDAYGWVKHINYADDAAIARVWYVSQEKLEPRLGERFHEPIEPFEQPLAPGRDAEAARACLGH